MSDLDRALDCLETYVRAETPSGDKQALDRFADTYGRSLAALGARVRKIASPSGTHLVAELPGRGRYARHRPVLLVGHSDTVWPVGTIDTDVPWRSDNGLVAGPGTFDMKAGLVIIEVALDRECQDRPPVKVFVAADEEVGSPTSVAHLLAEAAGCAFAVGFESPHPDGALKVGRLGSTRVRIDVTGREAHAALDPGSGASATDELVDQLQLVRSNCQQIEERYPGQVLRNLGAIDAPGRTNVVNSHASAEIGLRFGRREAELETIGSLQKLPSIRDGCTISTRILSQRPTWTPAAEDLALADHLSQLDPRLTARPAAGAADTNFLGCTSLPTVDGFGPRGGGAHAKSEHILIESLRHRIDLLRELLQHPYAPGKSASA